MKLKSGYEDYCYSLFDDGFWYSLTDGYPPKSKDDLYLKSDEDAEKVMNALKILKQYADACEEEAKKVGEV